jgi:L-lactate utilization protein LutB
MKTEIIEAGLENCIYCGACFRYCILGAYSDLDGMELKSLVSGVTRIARRGYRSGKDDQIKAFLEKCTLQGYCDKVCPALVKPFLRNNIAKNKIEEGK